MGVDITIPIDLTWETVGVGDRIDTTDQCLFVLGGKYLEIKWIHYYKPNWMVLLF